MQFNTKGFLAVEALVGFVLFSFILALYLPNFLASYQQIEQQADKTQAWRWAYEGCQLKLYAPDEAAISDFLTQHPSIQRLEGDANHCLLSLTSGVEYAIDWQD